ncbi:Flp family type IVb pilin [Devosia sp. FKR38]|uniref:Flp family type IVb pilin n=1 Tax=Devosia sp. FKR38 TaxID=2562312 RepID=UPI001AEE2080|nr:Flp family type IVb pilin [Devosia sp. FKR38]
MKAFWLAEDGATAIEYALLGMLIGIAILGTFAALGNSVTGLFNSGVAETLDNKTNGIN